jgi:hypothetical protein
MQMELNLLMLIQKVYLGKRKKLFLSIIYIYIFCLNRQIFCDFGRDFQVLDTNGENPLTQIVTEISHVCSIQIVSLLLFDYLG